MTCAPNYPQGKVFPGYRNWLHQVERRAGVRVIRTWSYISPRRDFWRRILNFGTFSLSAFFGGLMAGKVDVIMSYSPPLTLGITAWLLSRMRSIPWALRVEDLYPEAAVAAGILKNRTAIRFLERLERFLYQQAEHISLISEGFRQNIAAKGIPPEKLSVAPVWADADLVRPMAKENGFRRTYSLEDKFVVMYAGALGLTSALEDVVEAASFLQHDLSVQFVFVGQGVKKDPLMRLCQERGLVNIQFLPFQPREQFAEMMAAADVSLVTLNLASARFSMPNKVFNIMSSGRPILAVTPADSEVAGLIQKWACGVNVPPGQPQTLVQAILEMKIDGARLEQLGHNGRLALEANFSRQRCVDIFEQTFQQVVA